jgi:predicted RNA binding protein YcfA (HicA-like mRNA interferase family)
VVPRKIRQLISDLEKNGFINRGGKGSHRNFQKGCTSVTISGQAGSDAKEYQEKLVKATIEKTK